MNTRWLLPAVGVLFFSVCLAPNIGRSEDNAQIGRYVEDLKSDKPGVRLRAAEQLADIGPQAAAAVPALASVLDDQTRSVRLEALKALEQIGPAARAAVPAITRVLDDRDAKLYEPALKALASIGRGAAPAAPRLLEILRSNDPALTASAAFTLARILPPDDHALSEVANRLVKMLRSRNRAIQDEALRGLVLIGPAALPALTTLIDNESRDTEGAVQAAAALRMMGPQAAQAAPTLNTALGSRNPLVVLTAVDALGAIGPDAGMAVPNLRKLLDSRNPEIRARVANSLGELGTSSVAAIGDLARGLEDRDENVRRESAEALGQIGPDAKSAIPTLVKALGDSSQAVVQQAARALGRIGPAAVPALTAAVRDEKVRAPAVTVLGQLGTAAKPAVGALIAALKQVDDEDLRREIIMALAYIGPEAADAAPELLRELRNEKSKLRGAAAYALGTIGAQDAAPVFMNIIQENKARSNLPIVAAGALIYLDPESQRYVKLALPKLIEGLNDKSDKLRREAAAAIRRVGPSAAAAVPTLIGGLRDPDPAVQIDFLWALSAIGPQAAEAVPEMTRLAATSNDPVVRRTACYALGNLGLVAQEAIPTLEKILQDQDRFLQVVAAWALAHINPRRRGIADEALPPLVLGLKSSDPQVRYEAVTALGLFGHAAKPAVPALKEIARADDESLREAVAQALQKIGD